MTVMVDDLIAWPLKVKGQAGRIFGNGKLSCHLTCDGDLQELHELARRIGMKRAWFQDHPTCPHYDLTPKRREAALAAGAVFVPGREQARRRRALRVMPPESVGD
jgi:hypothetical protein